MGGGWGALEAAVVGGVVVDGAVQGDAVGLGLACLPLCECLGCISEEGQVCIGTGVAALAGVVVPSLHGAEHMGDLEG